MERSVSRFLKRRLVLSTLTVVGCFVLFATLGLAQSASTQETKRTFESNIPPHVPLTIKIKKEKEERR